MILFPTLLIAFSMVSTLNKIKEHVRQPKLEIKQNAQPATNKKRNYRTEIPYDGYAWTKPALDAEKCLKH